MTFFAGDAAHNLLLPQAADLVWVGLIALSIALLVIAAVTFWRSRHRVGAASLLFWTAAIVVVPVAGSAIWLLAGLPRARRQTQVPVSD